MAVAEWKACPPRPLHHQVLLRRNLTITEQPDLHLVWGRDRIFIKPLPPYILDSGFWREYLCTSPQKEKRPSSHQQPCSSSSSKSPNSCRIDREKAARGLLYSYCALIAYPSDFSIAEEKALIPKSLTWLEWKEIAQSVVRNHTYDTVSPRYRYGELRLSRLNKIYRFRHGAIIRGFSRVDSYSQYADFFADHFGNIIVFSGYVVIVLAAMQVGLATDRLQANATFQSASYGLAVFSIVAPLGAAVIIMVMFLCLFVTNWAFASRDYDRRLRAMAKWDRDNHDCT